MKLARPRLTDARPGARKARKDMSLTTFFRLERSAVILIIVTYCIAHWLIRCFAEPVFTTEEAGQLVAAQSLRLGYEARQPPMLAWLFALATGGAGTPMVVFALKYLLMAAGLVVYYLAARNVLVKPGVSAAAVGAWALTYEIAWGMHEDLLGATGLFVCLSLTLHSLTRILTWRRGRDWFYLGVAMGLGLLTHHLYIVFPLAMFVAALTSTFFRSAMSPVKLLLAIAVALAIYSPYLIWLNGHGEEISRLANDTVEAWTETSWVDRMRSGGLSLVNSAIEFTLPLSLFWLTLFAGLWLPFLYPVFPRRSTDEEQHEAAWRRMFARASLIALAVYVLAAIAGVDRFRGYWMLPVMFTLPIWLFAHVRRAGEFPVAIRAFAGMVVVFVIAILGLRIADSQIAPESCPGEGCRRHMPIAAWSEELALAGFKPGTIVGSERFISGNMLRVFKGARAMDPTLSPSSLPAAKTRGDCMAVWMDTPSMPLKLRVYLENELGAFPHDDDGNGQAEADGAIRRNLTSSERQAVTLYYAFVTPSELCR